MAATATLALLLLLLVSSASAYTDLRQILQNCQVPLNLLGPCKSVSDDGQKPDEDCCGSFRVVKSYWPQCLCSFLLQASIKSSSLYTPHHMQLLQAPKLCGVPHGISDCPDVLGLPSNSTASKLFDVEHASSGVADDLQLDSALGITSSSKRAAVEIYGTLGLMAILMAAAGLILA
ncbi:hypothetical protein EJ110_NYTH47913 [Nymphaea thermarum]|nr:hypothetical protein EJ110_NYTH47913 [Nymphaea thermarum]